MQCTYANTRYNLSHFLDFATFFANLSEHPLKKENSNLGTYKEEVNQSVFD